MIETLESRRLLTATFEIDGTVLRITGTPDRDDVALGLSPDGAQFDINIFEDGVLARQQNFLSIADFTLVSVSLGDGADTFITGEVPIPVFIRGGRGLDSLSGGPGNDTILGGGGNDYIFGREGNDSLDGGLQGDVLLGGRNDDLILALSDLTVDDTISGGRGDDTVDYRLVLDDVFVHIGNDLPDPQEDDFIFGDVEAILGSPQNDTMINGTKRGMRMDGRGGDDTLNGGSGNDTLVGGPGSDTFNGNGGRDRIEATDGVSDTINGGRGLDTGEVDGGLDALFNLEAT